MKVSDRTKGILLMTASALCFAFMSIAVKRTGGTIPVFEQVFFRNLVIVIVAGAYLLRRHLPLYGPRQYQPAMFGRSILGVLGVLASFLATNTGSQADVSI